MSVAKWEMMTRPLCTLLNIAASRESQFGSGEHAVSNTSEERTYLRGQPSSAESAPPTTDAVGSIWKDAST
jgi:hypothetical protein